MTQQIINAGAAPNDGTGDPARTAFTKSNDNFTELYARGSVTAPQGRLTLQPSVPVMTTTQAAKTTIYYTPYVGNRVPIYDGTTFTMTLIAAAFGEISALTTDTTKSPAAIGANKVNDWFVWDDAGTVRLSHGPDWTNDTTRSDGTLLLMRSILVNGNAITNGPAAERGTYVGTTRSNASSTLDWIYGALSAGGTAAFFGVWNAYNRVDVATIVSDNTDSWFNTIAGWRSSNGSTNMRCTFVRGLAEEPVFGQFTCPLNVQSGSQGAIAIVVDAPAGYTLPGATFWTLVIGSWMTGIATYAGTPGIPGVHYLQASEYNHTTNGTYFGGDGGAPLYIQNGLMVQLRM